MKFLKFISIIIPFSISYVNAQTIEKETITDIEGNVYKTVVIGKYQWMAENLKTTKYNNGLEIPNVTGSSAWLSLTSGAYCWYNNDKSNAETYGALYNWYAVNTGNLCPVGWRVPSDEEWKYLEGFADSKYTIGDTIWNNSMGRGLDVGQRLKATSGWGSEGNGTDNFGFAALPGGERISRARFFIMGSNGFWWSSTEFDSTSATYRCMIFCGEHMLRNRHPKTVGFSVRCIRNK